MELVATLVQLRHEFGERTLVNQIRNLGPNGQEIEVLLPITTPTVAGRSSVGCQELETKLGLAGGIETKG